MFADMVGSSALSTRLDPEEQRDVVSAFQSCCANEIKRFGGMVAQYLGDGVLAYFGYPAAHEDDAERAVRAGLAILNVVGTLKPAADVTLQARIGIASGVVVVGDLVREGVTQENAAIGETTNLAARLQSAAEPNTIVISPETHRLVGALFEYRDLGNVSAKGFAEGVHARQVLGSSKVESRFEARHPSGTSPLLGREEELDLLLRRWDQAKRGEGRVVLLTGEPGIGKSRLTRALQERLKKDPHTSLIYYCSPYHQDSALHPLIGQLLRVAGIERDDISTLKLDKLEALLAQSSDKLADDMPLFAALLSIPGGDRYPLPNLTPQRLKERTLGALLAHVKRLAADQPVLMVFEDLHWIDPTSQELLSLAINQIKDQRILVLATARPEFVPPWPSHRHVSTVGLSRLDKGEGETLVAAVTSGKSLPPEVLHQIVERTDGVPLFIEELTKTVLESGLLREANNSYELAGPLPPLAIPSTLHASLLARLDRLASVKDVAQMGAAIGREFSYDLIAEISALPEKDLKAALAQLVHAELIFQRGIPPDAAYQFKHALVQETAYASLVRSRRQQLHGQIARSLQERFPDVVVSEPETVAHHFTEAGLIEPAVEHWLKAGQRGVSRSANVEAAKYLTKGVELVNLLPASTQRALNELDLYLALGPALRAVKGYGAPETLHAFSCARDLLGESGTQAQQMIVSGGLFNIQWVRAEHVAAREVAQQTLALATRQAHDEVCQLATRQMGMNLLVMGELVEARRHFERTLELAPTSQDIVPFLEDNHVYALGYLSWTLWILGYPEQAAAACTRSKSRAQNIEHVFTIGMALLAPPLLGLLGAEPLRAAEQADEALAHTIKHGLTNWENWVRQIQGALLSRLGDSRQAIGVMRDALGALDKNGAKILRSLHLGLLAEAQAHLGENHVGLALLDDAVQFMKATGERFFEPELYRLRVIAHPSPLKFRGWQGRTGLSERRGWRQGGSDRGGGRSRQWSRCRRRLLRPNPT